MLASVLHFAEPLRQDGARSERQGRQMAKKKLEAPQAPRRTMFDSLTGADANFYCDRKELVNEAAVETFFVNRMLADLDYRDSQIKTKQSISALTVSLGGAKSVLYKPDDVLTYERKPRWVIDAKNPDEELDKWVVQCGGYCLGLNKTFRGENPVKWFMLTNGYETRVYAWDEDEPLLTLDFTDFASGKPKYEQLRALLAAQSVAESHPVESPTFKLERPTPQQAKALFALCHRAIRKTGEGYSGAFIQFMKLMFVKLWCDRQLREDEATKALLAGPGPAYLPKEYLFSGSKQMYTTVFCGKFARSVKANAANGE
jgi:hypothetical protein